MKAPQIVLRFPAAAWTILVLLVPGVCAAGDGSGPAQTRCVALVQFDAVPEQPQRNLQEMERLVRQAVGRGARWVMFHEGTLADYTAKVDQMAESVPDGPACRRMASLAKELRCYLSFGLSERDEDRRYITPRGRFLSQ